MDEIQKINLKFFIVSLKQDKFVGPLLKASAKKVLDTPENQLDDLSCLQCLQEISSLIQYKEEIKNCIENVVNNWNKPSLLLCIPAQLQYYFCLGQEVAVAYQQRSKTTNEMCSFVKTGRIDGQEVPFRVYDNFLAMLDSVSVIPREDFMKAWWNILRHYEELPAIISTDSNDGNIRKNFITLLSCYEHIKIFEKGASFGS